jgi:hypothetical protein
MSPTLPPCRLDEATVADPGQELAFALAEAT